jgi:hypothetical protein
LFGIWNVDDWVRQAAEELFSDGNAGTT